MAYRGRLIFPFSAVIARLDTETTTTAEGYDHDFRTVKHAYPDGARGLRVSERRELPNISVPCQVEISTFNEQEMARLGTMAKTNLTLVMHFAHLEAAGLVNTNKSPKLNMGDRLVEIRTKSGALAQPIGGNVFAVGVEVGGFGLGLKRNLVLMRFEDREEGMAAGGS